MKTRLLIITIITVLSLLVVVDVSAGDLTQIQKMERIGCAYYAEWCDEDGIKEDEFYFIYTSYYEISNIEVSSEKTLEQVLTRCTISNDVEHDLIWFYNSTHYIDNGNCQWEISVVCGDNQYRVGNSCKTMYQNPNLDPKLLSVLGACHSEFNNEISDLMLVNWQNDTHFIDNISCQWQYPNQCNVGDFLSNNKCQNLEKGIVSPSPKSMGIQYCGAVRDGGCNGEFIFEKIIELSEPTSKIIPHEESTDELICVEGTKLVDDVCVVIDNDCKPDMYGNLWCDPPVEDRLTLERFLFESLIINEKPTLPMGIVILIISITITGVFVIWRNRK